MPDITYDVGRVSFVMKGAWNLATNYEKLDAVSYNGSLYIAKQNVPGGTAITNTTYWQLAAEKGDKGDTGGVDSVNGQQGDVWFPDSRQLISDGYTTDTEPFLMKGNDSDSDRFELAKKLGNTVGVNQQLYPLNSTAWRANNSTASFTDGVASFTATARYGGIIPSVNQYRPSIVNGHKYLFIGSIQKTTATAEVGFSVNVGSASYLNTTDGTGWQTLAAIYTASTTGLGQITCQDNTVSDWTENKTKDIHLIDLTLWFGSNDRIPSDLLSHPENWGRYYAGSLAYNAGTLESADGTVLKSIGRNVWDEVWENGYYDQSTGLPVSYSGRIRSKNPIYVIPSSTMYCFNAGNLTLSVLGYDLNGNYIGMLYDGTNGSFNIPSNCAYILFYASSVYGSTYKNDITISLYYPGESGYDQYYPYSVLAEVDTGSEVLRSAGAVADEKTPDGIITRKVENDIWNGTESWNFQSVNSYGIANFSTSASGIKSGVTVGLQSNRFLKQTTSIADTADEGILGSSNVIYLRIKSSTASTVTALRAYLASNPVSVNYELSTPTTEQGTAFAPIVATVKNGVLSWTNTKGVPVGHESHYFENLRKRVEDRLPDPPSADGTYRLTCTITGGVKVYSWEA